MTWLAVLAVAGQVAGAGVPAAVGDYLSAYEQKDVSAMRSVLAEGFVYYDYPRAVRYETATAFTKALSGYLAGQTKRGVRVSVDATCTRFQARSGEERTGALHLCRHESRYAGGDVEREEQFAAIYGVENDKIAFIERLGDMSERPEETVR